MNAVSGINFGMPEGIANKPEKPETTGAIAMKKELPLFNFGADKVVAPPNETSGSVASAGSTGFAAVA
jgi:hypothetical protein